MTLSRFSIRKQIFIGYVPVFAILILLAISSFRYFQSSQAQFRKLEGINKENLTFREIEKDIVELQRNVLVYSYVGYRGVLKKVNFLQQSLGEKFDSMKPVFNNDREIADRFSRMIGHYAKYSQKFKRAVKEKQKIEKMSEEDIVRVIENATANLNIIRTLMFENENFKVAYNIVDIELNLLQASSSILSFQYAPDSLLISETQSLIKKIKDQAAQLKLDVENAQQEDVVGMFVADMNQYDTVFKKIIRINRTYLHLVNVVMPGKAAEIDILSKELHELISRRASVLSASIQHDLNVSQRHFFILCMAALFLGIVSAFIIATGIARPVSDMAKTLSKLSKGKTDIEIPGQKRLDEVGEMAKAANEFNAMAKSLESQTEELEEFAYRTSHDLRSPLVSSIALLNLTQKSLVNKNYEKAGKSVDLVKGSLSKLEVLVKDILELTKTKNSKEEEQLIDLEGIICESLKHFSHLDHFERIDFQLDLLYFKSFRSQKDRFKLIIENLISNAIKYQDLNEDHSFIRFSSDLVDDQIVIEVEDNGIGIPKDQHGTMFTMFKRFHPKVSFGSGLGMYMMKKSIDILGGTIAFEDTGSGSKFSVRLPK